MSNNRDSNFEALRLFSMFAIIYYHLFFFFGGIEYRALWMPFHFGVIEFVLISGYFTIKRTFKGMLSLLLPTFFYFIIIQFLFEILYILDVIPVDYVNIMLPQMSKYGGWRFLTNTPDWYVKTYLYLFLLSPIFNKYLLNITYGNRIYLIIILLFVNCYIGNYRNADIALSGGKNIINFLLLYVIGNTISVYQSFLARYKYIFGALFVFICIAEFLILFIYPESYISTRLWKYGYDYNSPLLIVNSCFLFITVSQIHFKSKTINYLASSCFSLYLIHTQPLILNTIGHVCIKVSQNTSSFYQTAFYYMLIAIVVMGISIVLDKFLSPIYLYAAKQLDLLKNIVTKKYVNG